MAALATPTDKALRNRAHLLGLVDQAPVALIVTDRRGTIATWNEAAEQLLGWPREEAASCPITRFAVRTCATSVDKIVAEAAHGQTVALDLELVDRRGHHRPVHLRGAPLKNSQGQVVGVVLAALNATEWLEHEQDEARAHALGRRLAQARREAGLTQQELAGKVSVTRRSIQGYEAGAVVPYRRLDSLAAALGKTVQWFLTGDDAGGPHVGGELRQLLREELPQIIKDAAGANAA